jgi:hypothetical protein
MNVVSLVAAAHNNLLKARAIQRLVQSDKFQNLMQDAEDLKSAEALILKSDINGLRVLLNTLSLKSLVYMSYAELKALALIRQIPRYSRLSKDELLDAHKKWEVLNEH